MYRMGFFFFLKKSKGTVESLRRLHPCTHLPFLVDIAVDPPPYGKVGAFGFIFSVQRFPITISPPVCATTTYACSSTDISMVTNTVAVEAPRQSACRCTADTTRVRPNSKPSADYDHGNAVFEEVVAVPIAIPIGLPLELVQLLLMFNITSN